MMSGVIAAFGTDEQQREYPPLQLRLPSGFRGLGGLVDNGSLEFRHLAC